MTDRISVCIQRTSILVADDGSLAQGLREGVGPIATPDPTIKYVPTQGCEYVRTSVAAFIRGHA